MAGRKAIVEPLVLIPNDDFESTFVWKVDGVPTAFPAGYELYYQFQDGPGDSWTGGSKWTFTINAETAYLRKESEVANAIADRTPYQLFFKKTSETPTLDKVLVQGRVARQVIR